jgi:hypothetical protein
MTDKKKNIDRIIKESFQSEDFDFENSSWGNIENKLNTSTSIDKIVYSAFNPEPTQLPKGAWEDMNDALDIETVWKRLGKRSKRRPIVFWWKVAGVLLLFFLFGYKINHLYSPFVKYKQIAQREFIQNKSKVENSEKTEVNKTVIETNSTPQEDKTKVSRVNNSTLSFNNIIDDIVNINKKESINGWESLRNNLTVRKEIEIIKLEEIKLHSIRLENTYDIEDNNDFLLLPRKKHKFILGVVGEIDNTWILDVETRLGYSKNSLVYNDFSLAPSYGVFLDYKISSRCTFGSEFFISSIMQTRNNLYQSGVLTKKETDLEYFKSTFSFSKAIVVKKNKTLQLSSGLYCSYLKRSMVKYDNVINNINSGFKFFDYGFIIGLSHHIDLKRFRFSYGIRSTYGLNNIFESESTPTYLNNTRNITYGLNFKLGYKI